MQRTIYDQAVTPGQAKQLVPALAELYPAKTHETTLVPFRTPDDLKRVRIVIAVKAPRSRSR